MGSPGVPQETTDVRRYAQTWLAMRDLTPRTRALYESILRTHITSTFGSITLPAITSATVKEWFAGLDPTHRTARANAYGLLRTILADAVDDDLIGKNPARIKGAGTKRRQRELRVLRVVEFNRLVDAIPDRYRALVLLGGWCALHFGELAALRRSDLDLKNGVVHVRWAVTTVKGSDNRGRAQE